jgi:purine-binding chemotaxis protein CheW
MTSTGTTRGIGSYILFTVAATTYALPSGEVRHMEMIEDITRVPNAPSFIDGVVFSRGQVVPVVNLRARFGFERTVRLENALWSRRAHEACGRRSPRVRASRPTPFNRPTSADGMSGRYVDGIASVRDRLILVLNLDRILNFAEAQTVGLGQ